MVKITIIGGFMYKNTLLLLGGLILANPMVAVATQEEAQKKNISRSCEHERDETFIGAIAFVALGTGTIITGAANALAHSRAQSAWPNEIVDIYRSQLCFGTIFLTFAGLLAHDYFKKIKNKKTNCARQQTDGEIETEQA
jgi:hypothetical protein